MRTATRVTSCVATAGLLATALWGAGAAHADNADEQQACQLMDDPSAAQQGYAPAEYTFMVLRGRMSAQRARDVMSLAAQEVCPNHIIDLPASWR